MLLEAAPANTNVWFSPNTLTQTPLFKSLENSYHFGKKWCLYALNNHTDLISNLGVLIATTCFLASKVFANAPAFLPRLAIIILNRGVIIWVNEQVRDLTKSCFDLRLIQNWEWEALVTTALKVAVKTIDLMLTLGMFGASCAIFFGLTEVSSYLYRIMRPFALGSLITGLGNKIYDYYVDNTLLKHLNALEKEETEHASLKIATLMKCFLEVLVLPLEKQQKLELLEHKEETLMARKIVRQLDIWTIQTYREALKEKSSIQNARIEAIKLFYSLKDSMVNRQASIEANVSLMTLGYGAMAISRAWPDTAADMSARWVMSVLYTDELVRQKFFQWDLSQAIKKTS